LEFLLLVDERLLSSPAAGCELELTNETDLSCFWLAEVAALGGESSVGVADVNAPLSSLESSGCLCLSIEEKKDFLFDVSLLYFSGMTGTCCFDSVWDELAALLSTFGRTRIRVFTNPLPTSGWDR
jgi:hypothetical protein